MTTEQPYFTVRVTRCGECRELKEPIHTPPYCAIAEPLWPYPRTQEDAVRQNAHGITPTCPMWPQRVEPTKD